MAAQMKFSRDDDAKKFDDAPALFRGRVLILGEGTGSSLVGRSPRLNMSHPDVFDEQNRKTRDAHSLPKDLPQR
jgi:hypothetical protein